MMIKDLIKDLEQLAARSVKGGDAEFVLYDRFGHRELRTDPDNERHDFEVLFGDDKIVVEFD